jgi:hypothetical protein
MFPAAAEPQPDYLQEVTEETEIDRKQRALASRVDWKVFLPRRYGLLSASRSNKVVAHRAQAFLTALQSCHLGTSRLYSPT